MNSAGCPAASIACRMAPMRLVTPVEVSLCTTMTALTAWLRSAASRASTTAGSTPWRQLLTRLRQLVELMGNLALPGSVVEMADDTPQRNLREVRKAGVDIMMSVRGDGKPVSFIEDCAVPLEHLADYTDALTKVFAKHGTHGTCMPMPRSAPCTCAQSSTCVGPGRTAAPPRCAPSPKRPPSWCPNTRAPIAASVASVEYTPLYQARHGTGHVGMCRSDPSFPGGPGIIACTR